MTGERATRGDREGTPVDGPAVTRRTLLGSIAGAAALAGCGAFERGADATTTPVPADRARGLAERFAPALYFDAAERWFPTDPRPYERERDGQPVVDGFAALDGYTDRFDPDAPPDPAVFYNAVAYEDSPLTVVQYWFYAAFDQFTTNFHWHDWEVLHVFVDTSDGSAGTAANGAAEPVLYVASSHSRRVPNNEYLDPDPDRQPTVLSELGSHSSALSVNDAVDEFQRLSVADLAADITNSAIDGIEDVIELPLAYGLPRDEGGRLPFVIPELDGAPIYEHDRLPSVDRSDLLPPEHTIRSYDALSTPPGEVPERSTGLVFGPDAEAGVAGPAADPDVTYDLAPTADLEHLTAFTGPQLSFEFAVPQAVEDAVASHLTAPSAPWEQPRYENPASDISDPTHRRALADRYDAVGDPAPVNTLLARAVEAVPDPDAPDGKGVTTTDSRVEAVALVESDPVAVPTFGGVAAVSGLPAGDHRLTVNGAGLAPHSETVSVGDAATGTDDAAAGTATDAADDATGTDETTDTAGADAPPGVTLAGADGSVPLVARESATKLAVDPADSGAELTDLAVEDDFGGRLYDAPLSGPDAVYVHRGGAYTAEVRDADDAVGAVRVVPDAADGADERVAVEGAETGKASLARYVAEVATETRDEVAAELDGEVAAELDDSDADDAPGTGNGNDGGGNDGGAPGNALRGFVQVLEAIAAAAERAAERAESGQAAQADASIEAVAARLARATDRLESARSDLPPGLAGAAERRFEQIGRRASQARRSEKL